MRLYYRWFLALLFALCLIIFWQNYVQNFEVCHAAMCDNFMGVFLP